MDLRINGRLQRLEPLPERTLLTVLRDELDLTGSKYGCGEGQCGACTVLIDGQAARSCLVRVGALEGKAITTIEGLAKDGTLHPLQEAFVAEGAFQCGYCAPGMVLAAAALLGKSPRAGREEVARALDGNLCRCGVYQRILAAVARAQKATSGGAR